MARKHKHEDHTNHEAWAIPYGDLITLLLAFFVVMYAVSSVNEGKYRVLADSLSTAFGGPPRSLKPVQIGDRPEKGTQTESLFSTVTLRGFEQDRSGVLADTPGARLGGAEAQPGASESQAAEGSAELRRMADAVQQAMRELILQDLVIVRRTEQWLEIEIKTDILFPSGSARLSPDAVQVLERLAAILRPFPHALRIEGHTDNVPIATREFPSNWELSAARAASVVHLFMHQGIDAQRMTVVGLGEYHPAADNATVEGRNRNRRVVVAVIGSAAERREALPAAAVPTEAAVVVPSGTLDGLEVRQ